MVTRAAVRFGGSLALFGLTLVAGALMGSPDREFWPRSAEPGSPARMVRTRLVLPPTPAQTPVLTAIRTVAPPPRHDPPAVMVRQDRIAETPASPKPKTARIAQP